MSSTCPHNMVNFSPLAAEICWWVWGTPANFASWQRYCSDFAQRRPTKLCTLFGRVLRCYTIYTFLGALAPDKNFARCKIHFTSKSCVLLYCQRYCTALQQRASAKLYGVVPLPLPWSSALDIRPERPRLLADHLLTTNKILRIQRKTVLLPMLVQSFLESIHRRYKEWNYELP